MDKKYFFGKRYFVLLIFTLISLSVFAATEVKTEINTDKQKLSYAMGTYFVLGVTQQDMDIDVPAFIQAVEDALNGNEPKISMKDLQYILAQYKETVAKKQQMPAQQTEKRAMFFLQKTKRKKASSNHHQAFNIRLSRKVKVANQRLEAILLFITKGH